LYLGPRKPFHPWTYWFVKDMRIGKRLERRYLQ
jgi:hypothetical protein